MATQTELSIRDYPPPPRVESPIQLIQGWYYVLIGLLVAVGIGTMQSPTYPEMALARLWFVRCLGAAFALIGFGMIKASRRFEMKALTIWGPILIAVITGLCEVVAIANSQLPPTFLLDTGMEFGFVAWWVIAFYYGDAVVNHHHLHVGGVKGNS
jgi:uncharacterized membrane protein YoaT (DUF817 family)